MVLSKFTKTAAVAAATLLSSSTLITPVNAGDCLTMETYAATDCSGTATGTMSMTNEAPSCAAGAVSTKTETRCQNGKVMVLVNTYSDNACANLQGEGTPSDWTGQCVSGNKYVSCTAGACDSGANQRISSSMVGTVVGVSLTTLGWIFM